MTQPPRSKSTILPVGDWVKVSELIPGLSKVSPKPSAGLITQHRLFKLTLTQICSIDARLAYFLFPTPPDHVAIVANVGNHLIPLVHDRSTLELEHGDWVVCQPGKKLIFDLCRDAELLLIEITNRLWRDSNLEMAFGVKASAANTTNILFFNSVINLFNVARNSLVLSQDASMGLLSFLRMSEPFQEFKEDQFYDAASLVSRIVEYIQARAHDPELSPDGLAEAFGKTRRYLDKVMSKSMGRTLTSEILEARLCRSAEMFRNPSSRNQAISAIAETNGFTSAAHFSRAFKDRFDYSPSEFRQEHLFASDGFRRE